MVRPSAPAKHFFYPGLTGIDPLTCRFAGTIVNLIAIVLYFFIKKKTDLLRISGIALVLADFAISRTATILQISSPATAAVMTLFYPSFLLVLRLFVRRLWPVIILEIALVGHFFASFFFFPDSRYERDFLMARDANNIIIPVATCLILSLVVIHLTIAIHSILYANLRKKQQFLEKLAYHDQETGVPNAMELERVGAAHIGCFAMGKEIYLLADWIEIEITEGILLKLTADTLQEGALLKNLGVHFSIDDFGTGYSNISSLQNFEADVIKIDKCFIDGVPQDEKSTNLVRTMLLLGQTLGMTIVAEGVETTGQRDFLASLKFDQIQGYLYSKPLEQDEAFAFLSPR